MEATVLVLGEPRGGPLSETTLTRLGYAMEDGGSVEDFLRDHSFLLPLIEDARPAVGEWFPGSTPSLQVITDPDEPSIQQLLLSIPTGLDARTAAHQLDGLDATWWLDRLPEAQGKLCVHVEFR